MSQAGRYTTGGGGGGSVNTLTGNVGVATAFANNIFVVGTDGAIFTGAGDTLTLSFLYLDLPNTTAGGNGIIYFNAVPYISQFGTRNIFVGEVAGNNTLTTADNNTGMGYHALQDLTTGDGNTCIGSDSGPSITIGINNAALGRNSLQACVDGGGNVALGSGALSSTVSGGSNISIGNNAGASLGNGSSNIFIGTSAGSNLTGTESDNILFNSAGVLGYNDLIDIEVNGNSVFHNYGTNNIFVGQDSGNFTLTVLAANNNSALGMETLSALTTGDSNVAVGSGALNDLTTGDDNTSIGRGTMPFTTTGSNNIVIGRNSGNAMNIGGESNNLLISNGGVAGENNTTRIGDIQTNCYIAGINGVNVGSVATVVSHSGDHLGSVTITAGTDISITPGANTITISSTAASMEWTVETVDLTMAVDHGYIANKAGTLVLTLPAVSSVGARIKITGINTALGWQVAQGAGQQIFFGTFNTTLGAGGSLTSSATRDSIEMVCVIANTTWNILSSVGNITVV